MALLRVCPYCKAKVKYGTKCACEIDKQKEKYKQYKYDRADKKEQRFYSSSDWIRVRDYVKLRQLNCCVVCYIRKNVLIDCDYVHHIIPIKDCWTDRLSTSNLVCLCSHCHNVVHNLYNKSEKDKKRVEDELRGYVLELNKRFGKE